MKYVKTFKVLGENISIKDETSRTLAETANQNASNALAIANQTNTALSNLLNVTKTILIGDSYGEGYTPDGNVTSWTSLLQEYVKGDYITHSVGGSGFVNGTTFLQQITSVASAMTEEERNKVATIIVGGGYNDKGYGSDTIINAIKDFANYTKQQFKNAKIYVLELGWGKDLNSRTDIYNNVFPAYSKGCGANGIAYYQNCCYCLHDYSLFSSDGFHPNENGQKALANAIANFMLCGSYTYNNGWHLLNITPDLSFGTPEDNYLGVSITNDCVNFNVRPIQFSLNNITVRGGEWIKIGTINTGVISGYNRVTPFAQIDVPAWVQNNLGAFYTVNAKIVFDSTDNGVYIMITNVQPDTSGYFVLENTKAFRFMGAQAMLPSFLC